MKFIPLYKVIILIVQEVYKTVHFKQLFFSCHLRIICFPITNSFISCTLFNSYITIQILTLIMMFREKKIYVLYHFLNQTIGNMVHTSYVAHNVCIWMKFAPLYKGIILIVQGKCVKCIRVYKTPNRFVGFLNNLSLTLRQFFIVFFFLPNYVIKTFPTKINM